MAERARNLTTMLSVAKDTSELMVDLAYGALFFGETPMAKEVFRLSQLLTDLVHEMRVVCILGARAPRDAEAMSAVLGIVSAIERIGDAAVDIAEILTRALGIPSALVADLAGAEEISHRVRVRPGSAMDGRTLADVELPTETGLRVIAIRSGTDWTIDPDGSDVVMARDALVVEGPAAGIPRLRELAGAPAWRPPTLDEQPAVSDLDRAVDALVEMKDMSEVAVALAYSALLFDDPLLAAEVHRLDERLGEMRERLETWVLRAGSSSLDPSELRGLLHLAEAARTIGASARSMVWPVEEGEEVHPVLAAALGKADEVVVLFPIAPGSTLDGITLPPTRLVPETGFTVLAVRRAGAYAHRARARIRLQADDEILAIGPDEGRDDLAAACGYVMYEDEETGEIELEPAAIA
jgi:uncharacterized protein with PhoU and TrkA domain